MYYDEVSYQLRKEAAVIHEDSLAKLAAAQDLMDSALLVEDFYLAKLAGDNLTPEQVTRAHAVKKEGIGYASAATAGGMGEAVGAFTGGLIGSRIRGTTGATIGAAVGTGIGQSLGSFTGAMLSPKIDRLVNKPKTL